MRASVSFIVPVIVVVAVLPLAYILHTIIISFLSADASELSLVKIASMLVSTMAASFVIYWMGFAISGTPVEASSGPSSDLSYSRPRKPSSYGADGSASYPNSYPSDGGITDDVILQDPQTRKNAELLRERLARRGS